MHNLVLIILLLSGTAAWSQRKGFEEYYYPGTAGLLPAVSSKIFYETGSKWYGEVRYNYEAEKTLGLSVGKTFCGKGNLSYTVTPVAGLSVGRLQGASLGLNGSLSYKSMNLSSSLQLTSSMDKKSIYFLYGWTELDWRLSEYFFAGVSLQQSCLYHVASHWEPGIQFGLSLKDWILPLYVFNPTGSQRYLAMGVCRQWN